MNGKESELANQVPDNGMIASATRMRARDPWEMEQRRPQMAAAPYPRPRYYAHKCPETHKWFVVLGGKDDNLCECFEWQGRRAGEIAVAIANALNFQDRMAG